MPTGRATARETAMRLHDPMYVKAPAAHERPHDRQRGPGIGTPYLAEPLNDRRVRHPTRLAHGLQPESAPSGIEHPEEGGEQAGA
jgi:hypothetical protein